MSDFGLPRRLPFKPEPGSSATKRDGDSEESYFVGSCVTWAPELLAGGSASKASDVYAFGALLCEVRLTLPNTHTSIHRKKLQGRERASERERGDGGREGGR